MIKAIILIIGAVVFPIATNAIPNAFHNPNPLLSMLGLGIMVFSLICGLVGFNQLADHHNKKKRGDD